MEIKFTSIQPKIDVDAKKQDKISNNPVEKNQENTEQKVYPDANVMRAYSNVKPSNDTVSKQEVIEFLKQKICKDDALCEQYLATLTDSDGYIQAETFEFLKNSKNKFLALNWIDNSKEDGKINHNMLEMLDAASSYFDGIYNSGFDISNQFKDKNGRFNNDILVLATKLIKENPNNIERLASAMQPIYLTANKEFDKNAIAYHQEHENDKSLREILDEIYEGKNEKGVFSKNRVVIFNALKPHIEIWQAKELLNFADNVENQQEFIELAKDLNNDENIQNAFKVVCNLKKAENNKTELTFDKNSVEFLKNFENLKYKQTVVSDILAKINLPYTEYKPENIAAINKLLNNVYKEEDISAILDAAVYKAGDKKGQFSFENLDKYIDIYNNCLKNIGEVKYISNILSLETDDYALNTINKLYGLSWEKETRYGTETEALKRETLKIIFTLSTMSKDSVPSRQFYRPALDNLNKLMSMQLPMTSAGAFQSFMFIPNFDVIEKLEKIRLDEIGIDTGEMTNNTIQNASEEELFAFKDFMMDYINDKKPKLIEVNLNTNIKDIVEIKYNNQTTLYNMVEKKPVATRDNKYGYEVEHNDTEKNINVKQMFTERNGQKRLYRQIVEKRDADGNLLFTEKMERSDIDGVFNVTKTYPDGKVEDIVKAQKLDNGNILVEKNLTSPEGVKTYYRYEDDVIGNRIMDYKIVDTDGTVLMNQSSTFEVLDENHFITSRNQKSYDIKFNTDSIEVKNMQNGKTKTINVSEFTGGTQDFVIPLLKKIPGDELFNMKEINLKSLSSVENYDNASFNPKEENIKIGRKYLDTGVLLHEFGHAKDGLVFKEISEQIVDDPTLAAEYEKERAAARKTHSEAELDHLAYFGADYHYLGDKKLKEGIAESNMILDVLPQHEVNAIRAHYWMQDFPRVIAKLSKLLY